MYDYRCDYCDRGWVRAEIRPREFIRVSRQDYVALEEVPIGACDQCRALYYHASVLRQADALRLNGASARNLTIPVAPYVGKE